MTQRIKDLQINEMKEYRDNRKKTLSILDSHTNDYIYTQNIDDYIYKQSIDEEFIKTLDDLDISENFKLDDVTEIFMKEVENFNCRYSGQIEFLKLWSINGQIIILKCLLREINGLMQKYFLLLHKYHERKIKQTISMSTIGRNLRNKKNEVELEISKIEYNWI